MKRLAAAVVCACLLGIAGCTQNPLDTGDDIAGIHGTIANDTTWVGTGKDIVVDGDLTINADVVWKRKIVVALDDNANIRINGTGSLTIEEGVLVKCGTNSYFEVGYTTAGALIAKGSDSLPITFTKKAGVQNWGYAPANGGGILIYNNATDLTSLEFCIIEHATQGVYVDTKKPVIRNCKIRNNAAMGIKYDNGASPKDSASFTGNEITNNGTYPISLEAEGVSRLAGTTVMTGNGNQAIEVVTGPVTENGTWRKHSVPYIITGKVNVGKQTSGVTLTIQPGVICEFDVDAYLEVGYMYPATLIAKGSDSLPITFTKKSGVQNWGYNTSNGGGILIYNYATDLTSLEYCIIENATQGMYVDTKKPVIRNCKIRNNAAMGIKYDDGASPKDSASFTGNEISSNGTYPISLEAEGVSRLAGTTVMTGNGKQAIEVITGPVTESGTWRKHSVPYAITGKVNIGKPTSGVTLTIQPGVIFDFDVDAYLEVGYINPATLIANGTDSARITFSTSTAGSFWGYGGGNIEGGIWIGEKATNNTSLTYCVIEKATSGIYVRKSKVTISNCKIKDCQISGVVFDDNSSPKDSASFVGDTITGNAEYAIAINASQLGTLSGTGSVAGNTLGGIYVEGDAVSTAGNIWKKHDAPYIIASKVSVAAVTGASVTIRPGSKFLMATDAYLEIGYTNPGTVIAEGTAAESITFAGMVAGTSWGYAGGNIEGGIWIGDKATTTTSFKYCDVGNAITGFYIRKSAVTIKNCSIHDCSGNAITLDDNAPQTNIADNTYANNGSDVVVAP